MSVMSIDTCVCLQINMFKLNDVLEIETAENKDAKRCILTLFFNSLIKYLFLPDPPTSTFVLLFFAFK